MGQQISLTLRQKWKSDLDVCAGSCGSFIARVDESKPGNLRSTEVKEKDSLKLQVVLQLFGANTYVGVRISNELVILSNR